MSTISVGNGGQGFGIYATLSKDGSAVHGQAYGTKGVGVSGSAYPTTGATYGVRGQVRSYSGRGVYGKNTSTRGSSYGVMGETLSTQGAGVHGQATASSGSTSGVIGSSWSKSGKGVYGIALTGSGTNYGVYGRSLSPQGYGVYGYSSAKAGTGVHGVATNSDGFSVGVSGHSSSRIGTGVQGTSSYRGVYGKTSNSTGFGVYGWNSGSASSTWPAVAVKGYSSYGTGVQGTGGTYGVQGRGERYGVYGRGTGLGSSGVWGKASNTSGQGVLCHGDLYVTASKFFIQPHPTDPSRTVRFVCLEGNENGTYFRGTARLVGGAVEIAIPKEWKLVTEESGITVQATPRNGPVQLWVPIKTRERIVVKGTADCEFDYFVNGVRRGFAKYEPYEENHAFLLEVKGVPFGTEYPKELRDVLVQNGILNPDYTPNEATAAKLGWELKEQHEVAVDDRWWLSHDEREKLRAANSRQEGMGR